MSATQIKQIETITLEESGLFEDDTRTSYKETITESPILYQTSTISPILYQTSTLFEENTSGLYHTGTWHPMTSYKSDDISSVTQVYTSPTRETLTPDKTNTHRNQQTRTQPGSYTKLQNEQTLSTQASPTTTNHIAVGGNDLFIPNDPHQMSPNVALLAEVVDRQNMVVANGTDTCEGTITRKRITKDRV